MIRVIDIVEGTSVDGPGLRTSVYLAGCAHRCPGCHNPQSWNACAGTEMPVSEVAIRVAEAALPVTLTGGDPLFNPEATLRLIEALPSGPIWLYTGYRFEQILADPRLLSVVRNVEVVVDGPFIAAERDLSLLFRGSRNQRLIAVQPTLESGTIHLWQPPTIVI